MNFEPHTDTVTLTIQDEEFDVEVTAPAPRVARELFLQVPEDAEDIADVFEWGGTATAFMTDADEDLIGMLPAKEMARLIKGCINVLATAYGDCGERVFEVDTTRDPFAEFDLNDDGAVELEDWR